MEEKQKVPFYKKTWFIVLSLIIFFPVGLVLMWLCTDWSKRNKWIITAVVLLLAIIINPTDEAEELADTEEEEQVAEEESQNEESSEEVAAEEAEEAEEAKDSFAESRQSKPLTDEEKAEREESAAEYKKEQEEKERNQEKAEAEEEIVEESEVEKQAEAEEDQAPEQEIENTIIESLGEENIAELNITEYDGSFEVDVTFTASENFSANMTANGIRRDIVDTTLDLKELDYYVSYLLLTATLPLTDDSGNESDGQVMSASFNGDTIEELNADNEIYLYDNLENAADGFSAHPQFR